MFGNADGKREIARAQCIASRQRRRKREEQQKKSCSPAKTFVDGDKYDIVTDMKNRIHALLDTADKISEQMAHHGNMSTFHTIQEARAELFKLKSSVHENTIDHISQVLSDIQSRLTTPAFCTVPLMISPMAPTTMIFYYEPAVQYAPVSCVDTNKVKKTVVATPLHKLGAAEEHPATPPFECASGREEEACQSLLSL